MKYYFGLSKTKNIFIVKVESYKELVALYDDIIYSQEITEEEFETAFKEINNLLKTQFQEKENGK